MLTFLLCSILAFSMFPSVSAEFGDDPQRAGRVVVGAVIGIGCIAFFLICIFYMLRHRRRTEIIPLRQSFYQPARLAVQNQPARHYHSGSFPARGNEYGHRSYPQSYPNYSNTNLPTYDPPDIPPPAYAKEGFSKSKDLKNF